MLLLFGGFFALGVDTCAAFVTSFLPVSRPGLELEALVFLLLATSVGFASCFLLLEGAVRSSCLIWCFIVLAATLVVVGLGLFALLVPE